MLRDKHVLYQLAVQAPDTDARFLASRYLKARGRPATTLREDFSGTCLLSCEWVRQHRDHRAISVDLHGPTLQWGKKHNLAKLSDEARERITQVRANVLDVHRPPADIIAAMNFSYSVFKTRAQMLGYMRNAYRSLRRDGMLFMDAWGGPETQKASVERRRLRGFTYVWEQAEFDPVTYHTLCHIHFEFPNGRRMRRAFTYDWRLWTIPELRELMQEAGFRSSEVLWEGTAASGRGGNGVFRSVKKAPPDEAWVSYVIAYR